MFEFQWRIPYIAIERTGLLRIILIDRLCRFDCFYADWIDGIRRSSRGIDDSSQRAGDYGNANLSALAVIPANCRASWC